jgi:signal transduction histidine kinase
VTVSLSKRILLLFLAFSVLPVVFLGAGDYFQSVAALRAVLEARAEALAEQSAREVETAYERAQVSGGRMGPTEASEGRPGGDRDVALDCGSADAVGVALPMDSLLAWAPSVRGQLGKSGYTQIIDRGTGRLVFDSRCSRGAAGLASAPRTVAPAVLAVTAGLGAGRRGHSSLRYRDEAGALFASVSAAGPAWAVAVHVDDAEFIAPFRRARLSYLGLVLLVLWVAAGAFVLLTRGAFRALRTVTDAADQIEIGTMRPWLPPPGEDEVGRLSLAFRRMTERLEASVQKADLSQKLAAVGELATYLSHEIRNPLSSIRLSLQSLHRDLSAGFIPSDSARVIQIALGEVQRLDGVVRAVLEMGRPPGAADGRTCRAHQTLDETLDVLRPRVRAQGIELLYVPRAARDLVQGEAAGLRSAVINVVVNAIEALEGRLDGRIRISTWSDGGELHIRVADNGPGVPLDLSASIFEPFFTTKTRGNGIGLPTALRTVQPWGGNIHHEPVAAGSGAVFVIKLKLADLPRAETTPDETLITAESRS